MNELAHASLKSLLSGELAAWSGLPPLTSVPFFADLYGTHPDGQNGRLSGNWVTFHDFPATDPWPALRVWSDDGAVVRLDIDRPVIADSPALLAQIGPPDKERLPAVGYRFVEEDELLEYLYLENGLVLHVTDPTLPGGSPEPRIIRVRAFTPMSLSAYDQELGGHQPGRSRRPRRR